MQKIFKVSSLEVVLAAVVASASFVVTYYVDIVAKITGQTNINETVLRQTLGDQISNFTALGAVNTIIIVLFWAVVGLIAYTVVWAGVSAYTEGHNEVKVEHEYTNRGAVANRLRAPLIRLALIIALVVLFVLTLKALWPLWLGLFGQSLHNVGASWLLAIGCLLLAYAGAILNLYVFKVGVSTIRALE